MAVLLALLGALLAAGFGYGFGVLAGRAQERRRISALLRHESRMIAGSEAAVALESLAQTLEEQ